MIILYFIFLIVAVVIFLLIPNQKVIFRVSLALSIFLILSIAATFFVVKIGDKPDADAIPVDVNR